MSERGPAEQFAAETEARANLRVELPATSDMLESLAADYKAGKLPDDVKERIDALRDEYDKSVRDRMEDFKNDSKPDIDDFVADLKAQIQTLEANGVAANSEVMDTRSVTVAANTVDGGLGAIIEPVIDAVEDIVHNAYDVAAELVQIRAEHDPEGIYASRLADSEAELDRATETFDAEMVQAHDSIDQLHERTDALRAEVDAFHADHAPAQFIMSTTVDPNLPEQMAEETGEGSA